MKNEEAWYVVYTRSRQEKLMAEQLQEAGYTVYLPLIRKVSIWSDRKKTLEVPLFNSYVFVKGVSEKALMKDFRSFVAFLTYNNKPAIVWQHEIDTLKTVIRYGYDISEAGDLREFTTGSKVMVIAGPLKGMTGELISISDSDWFLLHFENLGSSLQVKIPPRSLKKLSL